MTRPRLALLMALFCLLAGSGCAAAVPYRYGNFHPDAPAGAKTEPAQEDGPPVEFGKPSKVLDTLANVMTVPEKILGGNEKIDNHQVSLDTVGKLRQYLERNDLADVAIYVNCYDPKGQWRRLRENRQISAGWRYTFGALSLVDYTLFPNRVLGTDMYNPYTNSLYINSDVPAIVMHEAAYAKQIHAHPRQGNYVFMTMVPGVGYYRGCRAVGDVLGYARDQHDWEVEREAYHVLYSQVGAETASTAALLTPVWWAMPAFGAVGAGCGQMTGRMIASRRAKQIDATEPKDAAQSLANSAPCIEPVVSSEPNEPAVTTVSGAAPIDPAAAPSSGTAADKLARLQP